MDASAQSVQGRRLLQFGVTLLLFSSVEGFAIPFFGSQRIGLSVHTLSALEAVLFIGFGLLWPQLNLRPRALIIAFWSAVYSALAIVTAYLIAAIWGVGNETIKLMGELPHGLTRGSTLQEAVIKAVSYTSAPTGLLAFALILWGLRGCDARPGRPGSVRPADGGRRGCRYR